MKKLLLLVILGGSVLFNVVFAEDKVEGEKPKEEKPKEEKPKVERPKPEIKDLEYTGTIISQEIQVKKKDGPEEKRVMYSLKTKENLTIAVPNRIGKEDAKLEQYLNKTVLIKGKGITETRKKASGEEYVSTRLYQLISVTPVEESKPAEANKPAEEKKAEEEKKPEESKPAEGGMK